MSKITKDKKILAKIIIIALPIVIQGIVFQLQSLTDKAFLGKLDSKYIAALGASQFPFNTTLDSLVAMCTGIVIIVSQLYGAGKKDEINKYIKSAISYITIISFSLFILWFVFPKQILGLLSVDDSIMHYCVSYVKICSFYFLFLGIDCSLQSMLLGLGITKPIMISGIIKVTLNIFFSWILIYGYLGFPALKVEGAAIGTLIANICSSLYTMGYCFIIKKKEYHILKDPAKWRDVKPVSRVIKLGVPTSMEYFLWNASNLFLIKILNGFSYVATTIYTLTFGIEVVVYAIFNGTSKATMTLMGQSIGAKDNHRANRQLRTCMLLNLSVLFIAALAFLIIPEQIIGLFNKESDTISRTRPYLIFTAFIMLPKSLNVVIGNGIRAYGNTKWMLYTQAIGSIFVVLSSYGLVEIFHLRINAIYITIFLDESIRAGLNYLYYITHYKYKKQVLA